MATTSGGYPYPVGSEFVRDGDNAIQALAQQVDGRAGIIAAAGYTGTANIGTATWSAVPCGTVEAQRDPPGGSFSVDATSIILARPGWWDVLVRAKWSGGNSAGRRFLGYTGSNADASPPGMQQVIDLGAASPTLQEIRDLILITGTYRVRVMVYQDSGATAQVTGVRAVARYVSSNATP